MHKIEPPLDVDVTVTSRIVIFGFDLRCLRKQLPTSPAAARGRANEQCVVSVQWRKTREQAIA